MNALSAGRYGTFNFPNALVSWTRQSYNPFDHRLPQWLVASTRISKALRDDLPRVFIRHFVLLSHEVQQVCRGGEQ
jgi:hypothetical protein